MSRSAKIEHNKGNGEYHMNPLVRNGNPVDEDEARKILSDWGLSPEHVNQIIEWFDAYGDLKDEIWSYSD